MREEKYTELLEAATLLVNSVVESGMSSAHGRLTGWVYHVDLHPKHDDPMRRLRYAAKVVTDATAKDGADLPTTPEDDTKGAE